MPNGRPLADFAPEVAMIAKQLGAAMTTHNVKTHNLRGEEDIAAEHVANNSTIRTGMLSRKIVLETLKGGEDIKKIERRHKADVRKLEKPPKEAAKKVSKPRKPKETQEEQSQRFIEKARELEVDEFEKGQEKAFGKVGLGKPKKSKRKAKQDGVGY